MSSYCRFIAACAVYLFVTSCGGSRATSKTVTFRVTGHITSFTDSDGKLRSAVQVGDPITITYSFDSRVASLNTGDPTLGYYDFYGGANTIEAQVGQTRFIGTALAPTDLGYEITVTHSNAANSDLYNLFSQQNHVTSNMSLAGVIDYQLYFVMEDPHKNANPSAALPLIPPDASLFANRYIQITAEDHNSQHSIVFIGGTIDRIDRL